MGFKIHGANFVLVTGEALDDVIAYKTLRNTMLGGSGRDLRELDALLDKFLTSFSKVCEDQGRAEEVWDKQAEYDDGYYDGAAEGYVKGKEDGYSDGYGAGQAELEEETAHYIYQSGYNAGYEARGKEL